MSDRQLAMVMDLNKCIGCQTCTVACKTQWTNRNGREYMYWNNVETRPGGGYPKGWESMGGGFDAAGALREGTVPPRAEGYGTPWDFNLDEGTLTFTLEDGRLATVPMQIIGTRSRDDDTFLWGWDHPSVPEPLAQHAKRLLAWAEANNLTDVTTQLEVLPEEKIWEYTVLAAYLSGAQGVFRPSGDDVPYIYLTYGKPTFSEAPSKKNAK